jgi:hypothetical protein
MSWLNEERVEGLFIWRSLDLVVTVKSMCYAFEPHKMQIKPVSTRENPGSTSWYNRHLNWSERRLNCPWGQLNRFLLESFQVIKTS